MQKKRLKLKKQAQRYIIIIIALIIFTIIGVKCYKTYKYHQTNTYHLLQKGYNNDEVNLITTKANDAIDYILNNEYNPKIISIINEKYFLAKNLEKYLDFWQKQEDEELKDIIAMVNTHANEKWYTEKLETDINKNEKMLVNKFYALNENYAPKNLKNISLDYSYGTEGENKLIDYAYDAFQDLWQSANKEGYYLMVTSSYRTYEEQKEIYDYRKETQGERKADETAARPGNSEHQTGLVVDMTSIKEPSSTEFKESNAYKWLQENAYKYGFIERYPENKTYITGYEPESWHWRYVGKEIAKAMHEEQITFDEYYAFYLE